ncbi:hypothetical protein [Bacillus altitudinis]|uniref:hypothetical protein n=1 Tax=Bacillus altitudinis TaxID=293387 RepID=UPI00240912DC|nr:hypothetical protein [Bacillus altitudinis]WEZ69598.1 hypothetical protein P5623_00270 [Bacillus altitudinis]
MNVYELLSSMFNGFMSFFTAMIWPIVLIIAIGMLKKPITDLIQDIATVKYGGFELNFIKNKLKELDEGIKSEDDSDLNSKGDKDVSSNEEFLPQISTTKGMRLFDVMTKLDVLITRTYLLAVDKFGGEDKNKLLKELDTSNMLSFLQKHDIINGEMSSMVKSFRDLPNHFVKLPTSDIETKFVVTGSNFINYFSKIAVKLKERPS